MYIYIYIHDTDTPRYSRSLPSKIQRYGEHVFLGVFGSGVGLKLDVGVS